MALVVLAALAAISAAVTVNFRSDPVPNVNFISLPAPQLVTGDFDWNNPQGCGLKVRWPWSMLKEAVLSLREARLLHFHTINGRGGYGNIYLSELGQTVIACTAFPSPQ